MKNIRILLFILLGIFLTKTAHAHVRYVVSEDDVTNNMGNDFSFLKQTLYEPLNIFLILATIVVGIIIFLIFTKTNFLKKDLKHFKNRADSYTIFSPWILRLSIGIALIGSGVSNTLISPVLSGYESFAFIQILIGFFIVAGFLVIPSTVIAVSLYLIAVTTDFYLIGNLDFLVIALALLVLDNEKPGIDHLLGFPKVSPFRFLQRYAPLILRIGIGGAMMFLAIYEKILNPHISEIVAIETGLINVIPVSAAMWVFSAGIIEFAIGLAITLGLYTRVSAVIAFVVLSLSFFYFNEDVYSHITLFGILAVLFITQGGPLSIDKKFGRTNPDFK